MGRYLLAIFQEQTLWGSNKWLRNERLLDLIVWAYEADVGRCPFSLCVLFREKCCSVHQSAETCNVSSGNITVKAELLSDVALILQD